MTIPPETWVAAEGALYAAIYATIWFARRRQQAGEAFDPAKFAATVLLGAVIGIGFALNGVAFDDDVIGEALLAHVAVIALLTPLIRMAIDAARAGWAALLAALRRRASTDE